MVNTIENTLRWHKDLEAYYNQDPELFKDIASMVATDPVVKCNGVLNNVDDDEVRNGIRKWYKAIQ